MIETSYLAFFRTLSNDTRLSIVLSLSKKPKSVTELVKETKMEQSRVSHNLSCLTNNGFVTCENSGKKRIYSLNKETVVPILNAVKKHTNKHKICKC